MTDLYAHYLSDEFLKNSKGLKLHYRTNFHLKDTDFSKPTILFNYGLVCNIEHWKHQLEYFSREHFPIIFHDYRFHFQSDSSASIQDCNFQLIVEDIKEILDFLSVKKTLLFGHSMGVNVCLEFAYRFPELSLGLVLISGTVLPPQGIMFETNYLEVISPMLQYLLEQFPKPFKLLWESSYKNPLVTKLTHKSGFNTKKTPLEFVETYVKRIGELRPELFFQLLEEMRAHKIVNHLEQIKTPSLVMGGDLDSVIPYYLQQTLYHQLPNAEIYLIKDGSHVPQVDFPESVNERILLWIKQNIN